LGGVLVNESIYQAFMSGPSHLIEFFHGYTYSGHPLAIAAAEATLEQLAPGGDASRGWIAKAAALALKAACDAGQRDHARRQIRLAARDCAKAAAPAERHPLDGRLVISAEQAATLLRLLRDPAASALVGWQSELTPEEMAEHIADLDSSLRLLGSPDTFATLKRFHG
jgi:beta-alanine--pyruvate transaminase